MSSEFVRRCVEVVVAKTLEGLLCHSIEGRGLGVLGDLLQRFVEETGRRASAYRDLAGRASGALPDVLLALHDLGTDPAALLAQITPKLAPTDSKKQKKQKKHKSFFFFFFLQSCPSFLLLCPWRCLPVSLWTATTMRPFPKRLQNGFLLFLQNMRTCKRCR